MTLSKGIPLLAFIVLGAFLLPATVEASSSTPCPEEKCCTYGFLNVKAWNREENTVAAEEAAKALSEKINLLVNDNGRLHIRSDNTFSSTAEEGQATYHLDSTYHLTSLDMVNTVRSILPEVASYTRISSFNVVPLEKCLGHQEQRRASIAITIQRSSPANKGGISISDAFEQMDITHAETRRVLVEARVPSIQYIKEKRQTSKATKNGDTVLYTLELQYMMDADAPIERIKKALASAGLQAYVEYPRTHRR